MANGFFQKDLDFIVGNCGDVSCLFCCKFSKIKNQRAREYGRFFIADASLFWRCFFNHYFTRLYTYRIQEFFL